jgi:Bacterial Ig domain
MLVYGHFGSLGPSYMTGNLITDGIEEDWWLAWTGFALPHGHNVLAAQWQNYPLGQNFGVNGSMLALGVLFLPITKVFGPIVTWNIAIRLAVAVSASSMCLVLRRWTTWWPAAFVGGLVYGISAYMAYYGGNYLFLIFVPLPPVFFLLLHEILVRQRWRPGRTGALLGIVCVLQFFIWSEVLAGTVVMGAVAIVLFLLFNRHQPPERWRYARTAFSYGLVVAGVLLLLPLLYTFAGPQSINGAPTSPAVSTEFPSDVLGAVVPSSQWLQSSGLKHLSDTRLRYAAPLYLGIPLVLVLVSFAIVLRKRRTILFAGALALIAYVLSLGTRLWVDGHETAIPLPFAVLGRLPILEGFTPVRFALYTALFAAGMLAIGLDELRARMRTWGGPARLSPRGRTVVTAATLGAVAAVSVIPLLPRHTQPVTKTGIPSFFTSAAADAIPAGSVVLAYPYPDFSGGLFFQPPHDIMLDQAVSGMRFKLIGGYGWFPSPTGAHGVPAPQVLQPASIQAIFDAGVHADATREASPLSEANVKDLRLFLHKYDVQTVVVLPKGAYPDVVAHYVTAAIGSPVKSGGVTAWFHVQHRLADHDAPACPAGGTCETPPKLTNRVLAPVNGAQVSGTASLDALAVGYFRVSRVEFYLTDAADNNALIATGTKNPSLFWLAQWNTTTVPNGTYTLHSVAYDVDGATETSADVSVEVAN